jgi:hypothetical protein
MDVEEIGWQSSDRFPVKHALQLVLSSSSPRKTHSFDRTKEPSCSSTSTADERIGVALAKLPGIEKEIEETRAETAS